MGSDNSTPSSTAPEAETAAPPRRLPWEAEEGDDGAPNLPPRQLSRSKSLSAAQFNAKKVDPFADIETMLAGGAETDKPRSSSTLLGDCAGDQRSASGSKSSSRKLWQRAMLEMSNNTRDLVMRAAKRVDAGQLAPEDAPKWLAQRIPRIRLLTDRILEEVWAKYDIDGNGILSHAELKELVREYLENGREEAKREIQRLLIYKFKYMLNMPDDELRLYMRNPLLQEKIKDAQSQMEGRFFYWLGRLDDVTKQMYEKMDRNADGTLTKQEFLMMFGNVCEDVCDTSYIKTAFLRICK